MLTPQAEADRLLRAAANGAGRGRLKSDTSLRPAHPPRALILATGEEKPDGESLIARMLLVEVAPRDIDPERLSACQRDADAGLYAQATAGYIRWLAPRLGELRAEMSTAHRSYRERAAHAGLHRRTPAMSPTCSSAGNSFSILRMRPQHRRAAKSKYMVPACGTRSSRSTPNPPQTPRTARPLFPAVPFVGVRATSAV